ncbi:hypothetical protein FUA26_13495 [Seonamhaeicola algicola]|uniref:Uncharacterized protein n=1 Tax=Seonamhaeicola algicola TaxID=1719036 RepID=A0A5C7AEJ1_9FLAO|nr:hypothetical protein [Seonamhaeicola algicola]TXE07230.1 hypothetical protein FUA26_13495 [Seonamhaeicola algicola]
MKKKTKKPYYKISYLLVIVLIIFSCSSSDSNSEEEATCEKTCTEGFILNADKCECEPEPCTLTCEDGFTLDEDLCECECTRTCEDGFTLNADTCECEEDEVFVAEIIEVETETATLSGDWKLKTTIEGFTGEGYIVWEGPNQFWKGDANIGNAGRLTYKINVPRAGTYQFNWSSYIAKVEPSNPTTEHNDSWLRFPDADDFYGKKEGSIVYPKGSGKTPNPAGENGNGFFKIYMNTGGAWTWTSGTSDNDFHSIYVRFDEAKEYTVEIAARSAYHAIDKFKLTEQEPE